MAMFFDMGHAYSNWIICENQSKCTLTICVFYVYQLKPQIRKKKENILDSRSHKKLIYYNRQIKFFY